MWGCVTAERLEVHCEYVCISYFHVEMDTIVTERIHARRFHILVSCAVAMHAASTVPCDLGQGRVDAAESPGTQSHGDYLSPPSTIDHCLVIALLVTFASHLFDRPLTNTADSYLYSPIQLIRTYIVFPSSMSSAICSFRSAFNSLRLHLHLEPISHPLSVLDKGLCVAGASASLLRTRPHCAQMAQKCGPFLVRAGRPAYC